MKVLSLVYECYVHLGPLINGQLRYTQEHFESLGLNIEDAEEELGFPRRYTDIRDPNSLPWRWETLRRYADGCGIDRQFSTWLGKTAPRPEKLPPYVRA